MGSALVAFSGGIDSMTLLKVVHEELGSNCVAATMRSCLMAKSELEDARAFCQAEGIELYMISLDPMGFSGFAENTQNRCYICKKAMFDAMKALAVEKGFDHVCEGSNVGDLSDFRPGMTALEELGIESPLLEVGMDKEEIRVLAISIGIQDWDKPSSACLASRIPTGEPITLEKLEMVEQAETLLCDRGFEQIRVRVHGGLARIEVGSDELDDLYQLGFDDGFLQAMHRIGFRYVTFDPEGYRRGSSNA